MATFISSAIKSRQDPVQPWASHKGAWYAAYTRANHEKRVAQQLAQRSVEHFLPLYRLVRHWKDRRVSLQMPLFPSYVFVRLDLRDRLQVLQVPGVAWLVGFDGAPAALPEGEIEALQTSLTRGVRAELHPYLTAGRRVRIVDGPFQGQEGILLRKKNRMRVVLSLDLIRRSISVEIDPAALEPVRSQYDVKESIGRSRK